MRRRKLITLGGSILALALFAKRRNIAQAGPARVVRLAEIQIEPSRLDEYKAALAEEIDASIRTEPGVLSLEAVALKEDLTQIRIFEIYANMDAYHAHLESPHFKRYKAATHGMIKSLILHDADPIRLGTKFK
jgi:quinol monooxygenase YgiN